MKKPLTVSLILLTMSAPAVVLAQTPTASQAALTQARAALAQAQAAHASQATAVKASSSLAQAQTTTPATTTPAATTSAPATPAAPAQTTPAQTAVQPSAWTNASLNAATYVVLAPSLEGNPGALSADQQKSVLVAMQHDLQGAILRKYPTAKFVTDASTPGAISLRPVLTVPGSLLPWNSFQARVELSQNGGNAVIKDNFGVLEVYQHQADAANYLFDRLVSKLP